MTEKRSSMGRFFCGHMAYKVAKGIFCGRFVDSRLPFFRYIFIAAKSGR